MTTCLVYQYLHTLSSKCSLTQRALKCSSTFWIIYGLSDEQLAQVKKAVSEDPNNSGFKVWDGPSLSKYIHDTFDVELGVRACQKLFHRMGFSLIRPQ
ncbi:MAG: winged helix-turn-helix domain-containing protein, partial [Lachnospiraceae bacterium]|nr:winged helix-turn-helix domain-containing protein [Lachnospiraceae bacterium]